MPDNKNPPENEREKISQYLEKRKCRNQLCYLWALSLSPYCWRHTEDKKAYRNKIQNWVKEGKSMEKFILNYANLTNMDLEKANFCDARLFQANLSKANLKEAFLSRSFILCANLSEANLSLSDMSRTWLGGTNLSMAKLDSANLSDCNIDGANLSGADLVEANMSRCLINEANLEGAHLDGANLSEAWLTNAKLSNAYLNWAKLTDVRGLSRINFSKKLTKTEKNFAEDYKVSYMTVKNYFIQSGRYDDASWAAFRERTLERIAWYNETKLKGIKDLFSWNRWKSTFRWSRSMLMNLLCGYCEKPWKSVASSAFLVIGFFIFYLFTYCIVSYIPERLYWWDYLCFSIINFTTLGYGYLRPVSGNPWASFVVISEAIIGKLIIALFVWTLARRYVAR